MKKILIVDDQFEVRELVEVTLKSDEYQVLKAESGEMAIEIAKTEVPDLIIMDVMMPGGMDGVEATRILGSTPETKEITVIMLTAKSQEDDRHKGFEAGAADYLTKPFSPLELIRKVESILETD